MKKKFHASHVLEKIILQQLVNEKKISCILFRRGKNITVRKINHVSVLYQKRKFFHAVRHENKIPAHKKPPFPPPTPSKIKLLAPYIYFLIFAPFLHKEDYFSLKEHWIYNWFQRQSRFIFMLFTASWPFLTNHSVINFNS